MKKVITLVRTSTNKQEIQSQIFENVEYLKNLGYNEDEIIIIGSSGASAIKVDEQYQKNINEFYTTLENTPTIELVFCWAIDRIGRNEEILMKFKNTLINKKIQLQIKEPSLLLLNEDGTVNNGIELAFSLFATLAKQEMQMKNVRFKRAKERNKRENRFNGGRIKYGYKVDENGYIKEDEDEAGLLRMIINEYITTNISQLNLFQEYKLRGYNFSYQTFRKFFEGDYYGCGINNYPPIFNEDIFAKIKAKIEANKTTVDKGIRNYFYGAKLIKCTECGRHLMANKGSGTYMCKQATKQENYKCSCKKNININAIDSIALYSAMDAHLQYIKECRTSDIQKLNIQILNEHKKINNLKEKQNEYNDKIDYLYDRFASGKMNEKQLDKAIAVLENTQKENNQQIATIKTTLKQLISTLEKLENKDNNDALSNAFEEYKQGRLTEKQKYEIVHQHISFIKFKDVDEIDLNNFKDVFDASGKIFKIEELDAEKIKGVEITVYFHNENIKPKKFIYNSNAKQNKTYKIIYLNHNKIILNTVIWEERINRHKAMKERKAKQQK